MENIEEAQDHYKRDYDKYIIAQVYGQCMSLAVGNKIEKAKCDISTIR